MELMEVIDPVALEKWIGIRFPGGGALNGGTQSIGFACNTGDWYGGRCRLGGEPNLHMRY